MKKISLFKSICLTAGLLAPAVALSTISCGVHRKKPETKGAIPIEDLLIENKALLGLKQGVDVSMYDTLLVPNNVVEISKFAFAKSGESPLPKSIKNIKFVDGAQILYIAGNAFSGCEYVENIKFSTRIAFVDERAFESCRSLKKLDFSDWDQDKKLEKISPFTEDNIFNDCPESGELVLPNTVNAKADAYDMLAGTGLGSKWFKFKPEIQQDTAKNVEYYVEPNGNKVFAGLINWKKGPAGTEDTYQIPKEYTKIGPRACYSKFGNLYDGQIKYFTVEEGSQLKKICYGSFADNYKLFSIDLSNCKQLESIDVAAFKGYSTSNLKSVVLPSGEDSSLVNLGSYAFYSNGALVGADISNTKIVKIGTGAFAKCPRLATLELPATTEWIGALVISENKKIDSITIPEQVTYIGSRAFKDCTAVESITFDENAKLQYIGQEAFYNCAAVTNIVIPDSVNYIGDGAFNIESLQTFAEQTDNPNFDVIKDGTILTDQGKTELLATTHAVKLETCFLGWGNLEKIRMYALANLQSNIEELDLSNTQLTYIGDYAFYKTKSTASDGFEIKLPNRPAVEMKYVGAHAFSWSDIKTINANNWNNAKLGIYMFEQCKKLTRIDFLTDVKSIPNYTFQYCDNITYIKIPNTVQTLGKQSFSGCKMVNELHLESFTNVPNWTEGTAFGSDFGISTLKCFVQPSLVEQWKQLFKGTFKVKIDQWVFNPPSQEER